MKEYPEERMTIERLWLMFHKDWLTTSEIAKFDGCSGKTARRRYGIKNGGMAIGTLAHLKCKVSRGEKLW